MHRALCRVIGRTCRKWRENEVPPVVGGEEVRNGGNHKREEFIPDGKYTLGDAFGWTAGLILAYEFTHGRRRNLTVIEERPTATGILSQYRNFGEAQCPFGWPKKVTLTPVLSQSVLDIKGVSSKNKRTIDVTPFIKEEGLFDSNFEIKKQDDDDGTIQFIDSWRIPSKSSFKTVSADSSASAEDLKITLAEKLSGDLLSVLGAFKFLKNEAKGMEPKTAGDSIDRKDNPTPENPPMTALELLEAGAELGSARALYNIGVAYDRMKEYKLAREYYNRASDLGHPLASYNYAVFLLRDGNIRDGLSKMKEAAEHGIPEALKIISSPNPSPP